MTDTTEQKILAQLEVMTGIQSEILKAVKRQGNSGMKHAGMHPDETLSRIACERRLVNSIKRISNPNA